VQYCFTLGNSGNSYNVVFLDEFIPTELFTEEMKGVLNGVEMWNEFTISRDGEVNYRVLSALLLAVGGVEVWNQFFFHGKAPESVHIDAIVDLIKSIVEKAKERFECNLRLLGLTEGLAWTILSDGLEILSKVKYESLFA
jgi:hypothetical protein